jgi:hypothetical protein
MRALYHRAVGGVWCVDSQANTAGDAVWCDTSLPCGCFRRGQGACRAEVAVSVVWVVLLGGIEVNVRSCSVWRPMAYSLYIEKYGKHVRGVFWCGIDRI